MQTSLADQKWPEKNISCLFAYEKCPENRGHSGQTDNPIVKIDGGWDRCGAQQRTTGTHLSAPCTTVPAG